ncbi:Scr1 family TA system antitoxin-like transcriptional regulator [Nocardia sp. NPDC052112]|uniref:Scr1 family TA system antitoxin-like transcriptional regulator n=1 Tax=Nocardia sp. NPDC052112 TaxID=3155646 RepID=UPI003413FCF5
MPEQNTCVCGGGRDRIDISVDTAATALRMYRSARIPGLLQTEDHARSLLCTSRNPTSAGRMSRCG